MTRFQLHRSKRPIVLGVAGAACALAAALAGHAGAATSASPKLVLTCSGSTLVATVRGSTRGFTSVTFEFGAKRIVDRSKPFVVRVPFKSVSRVSLASAEWRYGNGQPFSSEATVPRCAGGEG